MSVETYESTSAQKDLAAYRRREIFRNDVLAGLSRRSRSIPPQWFYDLEGSRLFELITEAPEYYPSRTERQLLSVYALDIAALVGTGRAVIEFGSGSSAKTPLLLSAISPSAYVPIDISGDFLRQSAADIARAFPNIAVLPLEADFLNPVSLPREVENVPSLGFFPGSTIGNLVPRSAVDLLRAFADVLRGGMLLIGIDRLKSESILVPAYDDMQGETARFNLNLLQRINRELEGNIPVAAFRHQAFWREADSRIEMHLAVIRDVSFVISGHQFSMRAGETIHTENSYKYASREARLLLRAGGWSPVHEWTDSDGLFSIYLATADDNFA